MSAAVLYFYPCLLSCLIKMLLYVVSAFNIPTLLQTGFDFNRFCKESSAVISLQSCLV